MRNFGSELWFGAISLWVWLPMRNQFRGLLIMTSVFSWPNFRENSRSTSSVNTSHKTFWGYLRVILIIFLIDRKLLLNGLGVTLEYNLTLECIVRGPIFDNSAWFVPSDLSHTLGYSLKSLEFVKCYAFLCGVEWCELGLQTLFRGAGNIVLTMLIRPPTPE